MSGGSQMDTVIQAYYIRKPVKLKEEFQRNPDLKRSDLNELREWYKTKPYLPDISDEFLALFLHSCYFKMEDTQKCIEWHFRLRSNKKQFVNWDPLLLNKMTAKVFPLSSKTKEGYRVILGRMADDTRPNAFNQLDCMNLYYMTGMLLDYLEGTCNGTIFLVDCEHFSFGHTRKISLIQTKNSAAFLQEGAAVRLKGWHFYNVNVFMEKVINNIFKPVMSKEIRDLMHAHSSMETLYKFLPQELFPKDYGGNDLSIDELATIADRWRLEHRDFILREGAVKIDETLRPRERSFFSWLGF